MCPRRLLELSPEQPFIEGIQKEGIGCSGVLQRLDAHAQALKFINFSSEEEGVPAKVQRSQDFLHSFRNTFHSEKAAKEREGIEVKAYCLPDFSGVEQYLSNGNIGGGIFTNRQTDSCGR